MRRGSVIFCAAAAAAACVAAACAPKAEPPDRAVQELTARCENAADVESCKAAMHYWVARDADARDPERSASARDRLTHLPVHTTAGSLSTNDTSAEVTRHWRLLDTAAFQQAQKERSVASYDAFLRDYPHSTNAQRARDGILDLRAADRIAESNRTKSIEPLLVFAEEHSGHQPTENALIAHGMEQRSAAELVRIAKLASHSANPAFVAFGESCQAAEEAKSLSEATALNGDARVEALHSWRLRHPQSKRSAEMENLEAETAFNVALEKSGVESGVAFKRFIGAYPNSPRLSDAKVLGPRRMAEAVLTTRTPDANAMLRFLDEYPDAPQVPSVRDALAGALLRADAKEPSATYAAFLARFPSAAQSAAITLRMNDIKRREQAVDAKAETARACASKCEGAAKSECATVPDDGKGADSPKNLCVSASLRKCCTTCGTSIDTKTYAQCK